MHLSDEEFGRITFREFEALCERHEIDAENGTYRTAAIICAIYNVNRDPKKHPNPFTPEEIMGKKNGRAQQSPEEMLQIVKALHVAFGGKPIEG